MENAQKRGFGALLPCLLLFLFIAPIAGCKTGVPGVTIESPEAKLSPSMIGVASVFMKIVNRGDGDDTLLSAGTDIPGTVTELHDMRDNKMVKAGSMDIPAGGSLMLKPGGQHIMIFKMPKDAKEGSVFTLVLTFKKSGEKRIPLQLINAASNQMHMHK